ncbi:NCK-interacting protein with SH3 domain-like [Homarus americanus]|uniref:NCK-interacting protein with SH3 domain-like n=1 Tax=Homarus americanus TaxID=6706 RepID=A0A8J5MYL3_HOMAM|nr:NCK-interacting protein with SH3 domain-like [Homarus americanus]
MLRSLYAYKGTHARTLGFQVGEKFLEIGPSRDPNWMHVISERGAVGYVPKNYMGDEEAPAIDLLEFIDGCIEATHLNASERGGNYTKSEHDALHKLVELRQHWYAKCPPSIHPNKRPAPPPPQVSVSSTQRTTSQLSVDSLSSQTSISSLPSPSLPGTPRLPSLSASVSSASLGLSVKDESQTENVVETTTSFMSRGESLARDESSGSSEGHDTSIGYESEMRSDVDSGVQASVKLLLSQVPDDYLRTLVEEVRSSTSISYTTSHQGHSYEDRIMMGEPAAVKHSPLGLLTSTRVVEVVLNSLGTALPVLQPLCSHILFSKGDVKDGEGDKWQQSSDGRHLVELLEKLRECKDDEQQRSWALHEDEHTISTHLSDLLDLLVFGAVCQMSAANISYLSASVFPVELAREMLDPTCSEERLQYTSLVLGMVMCMGDTIPYPHFCVMNDKFIGMLLDGIENFNEDPDTEQLAELYLTLVLAFNLQYATLLPTAHSQQKPSDTSVDASQVVETNHVGAVDSSATDKMDNVSTSGADMENVVIKLLSQRKSTKYFTEKLLLLFNREDDPLAMFDHEPRPPNSVLKMMRDMYSTQATASIFYTNDERVACDIIIRQLTDLPADDTRP